MRKGEHGLGRVVSISTDGRDMTKALISPVPCALLPRVVLGSERGQRTSP